MRENKYRAWDTKRKKMWSAEELGKDQVTLSPDGRGFMNVSGVSTRFSQYSPHLIPLQYTDLEDKNGKEIYDGDVIRRAYKTQVLHYFDHEVKWDCERTGWYCGELSLGYIYKKDEIEIIGNIHENPELMETKNE